MANILVTGGAGFIGSHVCEALLARGDRVICIDNFNDQYSPQQKEKNLEECQKNSSFSLYSHDIGNKKAVEDIFETHEIHKVIHLAARAGVRASLEIPEVFANTNVTGTINLLEAAQQYKVKMFVFASSSSVYGKSKNVPFSEDDPVMEQVSPYAATKRAGELLCSVYHHLYNVPIVCLRFFTVYGPRGRPDMAPFTFIHRISQGMHIERFGDGTSKRDYTYVADVVDGLLKALDADLQFEIMNIGSNKPIQLNEFISIIEKQVGKPAMVKGLPMQLGDVDITFADITKAKNLLGWQPTTTVHHGMKQMVKWYKVERTE